MSNYKINYHREKFKIANKKNYIRQFLTSYTCARCVNESNYVTESHTSILNVPEGSRHKSTCGCV
jgi:hypothetical protein